jgi:monoamine oxidase
MLQPEERLNKQEVLDIVIIGGGLSGVMLAHELYQTTTSWTLLEARSVLGGRLANDEKGHTIDLGGAWIWPDHQPHMRQLLKTKFKNVPTFEQPDDPSSTRIDGGAVTLIHIMAEGLPQENIILNSPVTNCNLMDAINGEPPLIQVHTSQDKFVLAKRVVVAVPPKIVSEQITFDPPLSPEKQQAMTASHTWMAGVTKVSLVYPTRFWNEDMSNMGLPSHMEGPAFQVYDSSTKDGFVSALTFFTLVPPQSPAWKDDKLLADQVASQIATVWKVSRRTDFTEQAKSFTDIHVKRWPLETYISEDPKPLQIHGHPSPVRALSTNEWGGRLLFAGSETDQRSPGVMEGAVGAALRVWKDIQQAR